MTAFLLVWRALGTTDEDRDAVARARTRMAGGEVQSPRPGVVGVGALGDVLPPQSADAAIGRPFDGPALYVAAIEGGSVVATDLCAILLTGLVPRRFDPAGFSGMLWRGGAMDARLPVAGIRAVPPGGRVVLGRDGAEIVASPLALSRSASDDDLTVALEAFARRHDAAAVLSRGGHASLALLAARHAATGREPEAVTLRWGRGGDEGVAEAGRAAASVGARHRVLDVDVPDPDEALTRHLEVVDLPSVDGFAQATADETLRRASVPLAASSVGGALLFGASEALRRAVAPRRTWLDRSRAPSVRPDPLDVSAQRDVELRAFTRVPLNAAHAALSLLPAATRETLLSTGSRPPDPFLPSGASALDAATELAVRSVLPDTQLRTERPGILRPWLSPELLAVALGLPSHARIGRTRRDGWLARRVRAVHGWAAPRRADSPAGALDAWARGLLKDRLASMLAPDRVAATGAFRPAGVSAALERWRQGQGADAFDARRLLFLAQTVAWLEREGLRGAPS
ncbi:MAG TPA: asparagine synthase-related protein [Planctomycetota bacterium]|nr:asparagine synthase-related protein [Planctomycetota bacterium]